MKTIDKIVLIKTAPEKIIQGQWYHRPWLGLGAIASFLIKSGIQCEIVDMEFYNLSLSSTIAELKKTGSFFFGITAMTHEITRAHEVATAIKSNIPESRVVVGGSHVTALPLETMRDFFSFDFGIFGEGEYTLMELLDAYNNNVRLDIIKGLAFRKNGQIIINKQREMIDDLDSLPLPAWNLYSSVQEYPVFSSRGCPFSCKFCMRVLGNKVRYRSPESVVDEVEYLVNEFGAKRISFQDETFTVNKARVNKIIDLFFERGLHNKVSWDICARVTDLSDDLCRRLKGAGCYKIGTGIESGNDEILEKVGKGITTSAAIKGISTAKKAGLQTEAYFILGHPNEKLENIRETIRFAARLNTTSAAFGIMVPYPGTEIYDMAIKGEGGYKLISRDWVDFNKHLGNAMELKNVSRRQLEKEQIRAYLTFYIKNLRFKELFKYVLQKRKAVNFIMKKLFFCMKTGTEK